MLGVWVRSLGVAVLVGVWIALCLAAVHWLHAGRTEPIQGAAEDTASSRVSLTVSDAAEIEVLAHCDRIRDSMYNFHFRWDELANFQPAIPLQSYRGSDFRVFMPSESVAVGDTWNLEEEGLLTFLRQFHAGATLELHINNGDSPGAYACLRRFGADYAEIVFRIYAEFVLRHGFLTPGQFTGSIVLDRANGRIAFFHMYLPPAPINFDTGMEVTLGGKVPDKAVEVRHATDAGCIPRMELVGGDPGVTRGVPWTAAKSLEEVKRGLELCFYRFKHIEWVGFEKALGVARTTGKPLHVIAVDGTLDDESCCGSGKALRAGPLSDSTIIEILNREFVTTWVLNEVWSRSRIRHPTRPLA